MRAYFRELGEFYLGFLTGLLFLFIHIIQEVKRILLNFNTFLRIYLFNVLFAFFLLTRPWRSYSLVFDAEKKANHGIYTDDFLFIFILLVLSLLYPLIRYWNSEKEQKVPEKFGTITFYSGWGIISLLYVLTFFFPGRVAPVEEASFSLWYYLFGLNVVFAWGSGILDMKNHAQYSLRT